MRKRLGLKLTISEESLSRINQGELLRNIILHDGGKVSHEYLKRSGHKDLVLGQRVTIEPAFVEQITIDLTALAYEIHARCIERCSLEARREELVVPWAGSNFKGAGSNRKD